MLIAMPPASSLTAYIWTVFDPPILGTVKNRNNHPDLSLLYISLSSHQALHDTFINDIINNEMIRMLIICHC